MCNNGQGPEGHNSFSRDLPARSSLRRMRLSLAALLLAEEVGWALALRSCPALPVP